MYSRVLRNLLNTRNNYPLIKLASEFKNIFISQGFKNNYRWNFTSSAPYGSPKHGKSGPPEPSELLKPVDASNLKTKDQLAEMRMKEFLKNPDNEKHYKILELELEVMRQSGELVPSHLKPRDWVELLLITSRQRRKRFLEFLFGLEMKEKNAAEKRKIKAEERVKTLDALEDPGIPDYLQYKLGGNNMFIRIRDNTMNQMYNWRLMRAMMFSPKLVLDCGYEDKMTRVETKNCAKQLMFAFAANRESDDPLDVHFCNFNQSGLLHEELYSFIPTMYEPDFPINITQKSYLDLFPKDKLVYLTPDCHQTMDNFDAEAIYIVGAIVDKVAGSPSSLAKAKREGLRMAKLPIDKYLSFGGGSGKSLTINQVVAILNDLYTTRDWPHALRHVPRRKLHDNRQQQLQKRLSYYLSSPGNDTDVRSLRDFTLNSRNKFRAK
ncbi:mitochondrial ribonuclease P protein 1 homolog [Microplitis mediator]|uniref:mitochondrial ribonuclease P protein 1 homolog n=1 Tax=Microplitis mediator TaxID=375433 RepID=UPI002552E903|nr:mitochondrial ribonuclease P protein 1 homolog [Microplitis mediator]